MKIRRQVNKLSGEAKRYNRYPVLRFFFNPLAKGLAKGFCSILKAKITIVCLIVLSFCGISIFVEEPREMTLKWRATNIFNNAESIAIGSAAVLFVIEIPDRQKRDQYEAWQVINSGLGQTGSGGRIQALQDLHRNNVDLDGLAAPNADLSGINLNKGMLSRANFCKTQLGQSDLSGADLSEANLSCADLFNADLSFADLSFADLFNPERCRPEQSRPERCRPVQCQPERC